MDIRWAINLKCACPRWIRPYITLLDNENELGLSDTTVFKNYWDQSSQKSVDNTCLHVEAPKENWWKFRKDKFFPDKQEILTAVKFFSEVLPETKIGTRSRKSQNLLPEHFRRSLTRSFLGIGGERLINLQRSRWWSCLCWNGTQFFLLVAF